MARADHKRLRPALESWSDWCCRGQIDGAVSTGRTMLAKLIDNKGEIFFGGGGGGFDVIIDCIESRIEARVMAMAAGPDPLRSDVLRLEFDAGVWQVFRRRGMTELGVSHWTRFDKALALDISLATYKRRLVEAMDDIVGNV